MREVTYIEMNYEELERLIQTHYGKPDFEVVAAEEWGNDQSHTFDVDGELDEWQEKDVREFKSGERTHFMTYSLMNDLVREGKLKPGKYLINVCW